MVMMLRLAPTYTLCDPPCGPRSQGFIDESAEERLHALLELPRISESTWEHHDKRMSDVLYELHAAVDPSVRVYPDEKREELFRNFMLDLRQRHRHLHIHGKRPWPALMQAALANELTGSDCDALHALTGVLMVSWSQHGFEAGHSVAGLPLDTDVFDCKTQRVMTLLDALPPVPAVPVLASLSTEKLRRATHEVAAGTRVPGASGYRNMTKAEQMSETARRIAEVSTARKQLPANHSTDLILRKK